MHSIFFMAVSLLGVCNENGADPPMVESAAPLPEPLPGHRCPAGLLCYYLTKALHPDPACLGDNICTPRAKAKNAAIMGV
jgi:hypothetical protein